MEMISHVRAGSMESGDILIMLHPYKNGIKIELESKVMKQYGTHIKTLIQSTLEYYGVRDIYVVAKDSGALDYTIKSRIKTAIERSVKGSGLSEINA